MNGDLELACRLADLAGRAILPHFRSVIEISNKGGDAYFDPVTLADRAAEQAIREELRRVRPDDAIYGEEYGRAAGGSGRTWVIDPIDGTRSFIAGQLHWGILIALNDGTRPVLGVMHQPYVDETFVGSPDGAYWTRGGERHPMRTRPCSAIADAVVCTTHFARPEDRAAFDAVLGGARLVRFSGDCYNYSMLAAGFIDVALDTGLSAYDVQALIPMIEAAGGVMTTWSGGDPNEGGQIVASGDPRLHEQLIKRLA